MNLKVPDTLKETKDILEYGYNAQEALRLLHNKNGTKARDGIITMEEFREWQGSYFEPRSSAISLLIVNMKQAMLTSGKYLIDLDKDFV